MEKEKVRSMMDLCKMNDGMERDNVIGKVRTKIVLWEMIRWKRTKWRMR